MSDENKWIDALSEPAIALAAYVWKKSPVETWSILSRAIQNEELSSYLPLTEFQEYIRLFIPPIPIQPVPPITPTKVEIDEEWITNIKERAEKLKYPIQPNNDMNLMKESITEFTNSTSKLENSSYNLYNKEVNKTKSKEKNYSWVWWTIAIVAALWFCQNSAGTNSPQYPGDQSFSEDEEYQADLMEGNDPRLNDPCLQDIMNGIPEEFSRCSNSNVDEPLFDPEDTYQNNNEVSEGCPNGCIYYKPGCEIKGNISFDTGEKIYHVPGQEFYSSTEINPAYGELWFCTEEEAIANGWRKSHQ